MCAEKLMIIGAGGHGRVVADIAMALGRYRKIAFLDDGGVDLFPYPVLGTSNDVGRFIPEWDYAVAIGNQTIRKKFVEHLLRNGATLPALIHPSAILGSRVRVGEGTVVMAGTVINCDCIIGRGCIVNTGATLDHDNCLEDFVHICPGSHLAGSVHVGPYSWIGVGSTVKNDCSITGHCLIGAGAVVCGDILESGTYIGIPARKKE